MRPVPQAALALVKASEGMRVRRNLDPAGHSQIGYGHKLTPDSPLWDATLTLTSATLLALDDLDHVAIHRWRSRTEAPHGEWNWSLRPRKLQRNGHTVEKLVGEIAR